MGSAGSGFVEKGMMMTQNMTLDLMQSVGDWMTTRSIADSLGMTHTTIGRQLRSLHKFGFVDKRVVRVDGGHKLVTFWRYAV